MKTCSPRWNYRTQNRIGNNHCTACFGSGMFLICLVDGFQIRKLVMLVGMSIRSLHDIRISPD